LGFFGELLTGAAAAFAAFSFLSIFPNNSIDFNSAQSIIRLFGFGVLTGFAGLTILEKLSYDLLKQKIDKQISSIEYKQSISNISEKANYHLGKNDYDLALGYFREILSLDRDNEDAKIGIAISLNYKDPSNHIEPISLLNQVIEKNNKNDRAFYNRACIKSLNISSFNISEVVSDLRSAVTINEYFLGKAKIDPDFYSIKEHPDFQKVIYF
jgi:tetratricopeptide (TPR) repeat protein